MAGLMRGAEDGPERLVRTVLYLWQLNRFPELASLRAPWGSATYLAEPATHEFVGWLEKQPFNDAAYWLATAYAQWVGSDVRTEQALFFTPPMLADRVITDLVNHGASLTEHRWHDPACGGAAFLVPIAQRMFSALEHTGLTCRQKLRHIEKKLSGNDIDSTLLELSRSFLEMSLYEHIVDSNYTPIFNLFQSDGLTSAEIETLQPDVVACNPPYRKLKADEALPYKKLHGDIISGQPNVYGLFINRTLQLSRRTALVGLLTPTSFLSGQSFSKLRTKLLETSDIVQIDMLSDRTSTFIDVEQETSITVLRTRGPQAGGPAHTRVNVLTSEGRFEDVGQCLLPNSGRPWPIPRAPGDAELLRLAEAAEFRLSDYGYAAQVGHLVAYRDKRRRFANNFAVTKHKRIVPLVWATDIAPNGIFEHGRACRYSRKKVYVQVDAVRGSGVVSTPSVLLQRLTSSDQRSRLVAAAVPQQWVNEHGGFICENHVIVLVPVSEAAIAPELMAALLNTRCVDRVFRSISGASNVAVFELNELLLPNPRLFSQLCEMGVEVEVAVEATYGLRTL